MATIVFCKFGPEKIIEVKVPSTVFEDKLIIREEDLATLLHGAATAFGKDKIREWLLLKDACQLSTIGKELRRRAKTRYYRPPEADETRNDELKGGIKIPKELQKGVEMLLDAVKEAGELSSSELAKEESWRDRPSLL